MTDEKYATKTLYLAAFLYASSELQFTGTYRVDKEVFFEFTPRERAEQLVNHYFSDTASVNPRELFARLNALRDLIFSGGTHG